MKRWLIITGWTVLIGGGVLSLIVLQKQQNDQTAQQVKAIRDELDFLALTPEAIIARCGKSDSASIVRFDRPDAYATRMRYGRIIIEYTQIADKGMLTSFEDPISNTIITHQEVLHRLPCLAR